MSERATTHVEESGLPGHLRPLFWDVSFSPLAWPQDRDFVVGRVLAEGDWDAIQWLRGRIGNRGVREWILRHTGRGLSPQQIRFWELILGLPVDLADAWVARARQGVWERRNRG